MLRKLLSFEKMPNNQWVSNKMETKIIEKNDILLVHDQEEYLAVANGEWNVMGHKEILYYKVYPLNGRYRRAIKEGLSFRTIGAPSIKAVVRDYPDKFEPGTDVRFGHGRNDQGKVIEFQKDQDQYKVSIRGKRPGKHTFIDKARLIYFNTNYLIGPVNQILGRDKQKSTSNHRGLINPAFKSSKG